MRAWFRLIVGAFVVAFLATAAPAYAHVNVIYSDPAPDSVLLSSPENIHLVFDDPLQDVGAAVVLTGPSGRSISTTTSIDGSNLDAAPAELLTEGTWVAAWRVVSYDGHPRAGLITFSIGTRTGAPPMDVRDGDPTVRTLLNLTTGIGDLALLLAVGTLAIGVLVPALDNPRTRRVAPAGSAVAVLAAILAIPLSGAYRLGRGMTFDADVFATSLVGTEIALTLILASTLSAALVARSTGDARLALLPAAIAITTPAWSGHNRVTDPVWLAGFATVTHLAAAALWLGVVACLAASWSALGAAERTAAVRRVGPLAAGAVLVVLVEGGLLAWLTLGSWTNLWGTTYGRVLVGKVVVIALALTVAALLRRSPSASRVRAEFALLLVVPLLAGFLVNEPPERPTSAPQGMPAPQVDSLVPFDRVEQRLPGVDLNHRRLVVGAGATMAYVVRRDLAVLYEVPLTEGAGTLDAKPGRYWVFALGGTSLRRGTVGVPGRWSPRDSSAPTSQARNDDVTVSLGGALAVGDVRLPVTITAADGTPSRFGVRGAVLVTNTGDVSILGMDGSDLVGKIRRPGDGRLFWILADPTTSTPTNPAPTGSSTAPTGSSTAPTGSSTATPIPTAAPADSMVLPMDVTILD